MAVEYRLVRPAEHEAAGAVVLHAYQDFRVGYGAYARELADVAGRAGVAEVYVAVEDGEVVGCVTFVTDPDSPMWEWTATDAAGIRMLGVRPDAQGRGIGRRLSELCLERARQLGRASVVLHSEREMVGAHRLYGSLGFERDDALDWYIPEEDVQLLGFRLVL